MKDFLNSIFGSAVTPHRRLAIFTGQDSRTLFCDDVDQAVEYAQEKAGSNDVYFGLGLISGNPRGRGRKENVCAIGALWADIDLMSSAHKDEALPETLSDIESLLKQVELEPSAIVNSGHGVHAYWFLKQPYIINNKQQRIEAEKITKGWHGKICQLARKSGWSMPNLGDISRILRLPNTWNYKIPDRALRVELLKFEPELRYDIETIKEFLPDCSETVSSIQIGNLVLDPDAQPPADKMVEAVTGSEKFRQTWLRERADLSDQSQSGYDLSLATIAALLGWSDQEIANLIIAARRKHNEKPEKALRSDYISRTLVRARQLNGDFVLAESPDVDISAITEQSKEEPENVIAVEDPGAMPEKLLRMPGFVSELMDYCMQTAPYPNQGLAFCGALAMQSHLCARKVRDAGNLRTNLLLLALAGSSSGKDWPRQINAHIMMEIGQIDALGDKFASGEGIQDSMIVTPAMLFQNDEIDGMLNSINKARDGRHESIMTTLLTMHTSSGSIYAMRRKAGKQTAGIIDQPHLTLFGTATPTYYYESLSERMLSNGFFARMIVIDIGSRGKGQDAGLIDQVPEKVLETANWWANYCPGDYRGNLVNFHPKPDVIEQSPKAIEVLDEFRYHSDQEYAKAEINNDETAKAIWGRANENARKLALLYACSELYQCPKTSEDAAKWAVSFVDHQIRRMLFLASQYVSANDFDAMCLKVKRKLRCAPGKILSHNMLLKRMKCDAKTFSNIIDTLIQQRDIKMIIQPTSTKSGQFYLLIA